MKIIKLSLLVIIACFILSCNKKDDTNKSDSLEGNAKANFNCDIEKKIVKYQKEIKSKKELEEKIRELYGNDFVDNEVYYKPAINYPVSDIVHGSDYAKVDPKQLRNNFELYYNDFKSLVDARVNDGYSDLNFSFVYLSDILFDKWCNNSINISDENKNSLAAFKSNLYILITFKGAGKEDLTYLFFNLKDYYDVTAIVDLGELYSDFRISSIGSYIKSLSTTTPKSGYIPYGIKYDLSKVQEYFERIDNYFSICDTKTVIKLKFDVCFGDNNKSQESIYLTSIPEDVNGPLLSFPYYDQGSLEP
ncbi:hypothetical protein MQX03_11740 [Chryseobacterium aahli]|uniref:hypothetical protein n=1 Tax=Chryseobacterium aahli TaxID=1278643 RepID=UPI001F60A057|nr:hypothetical protein [Chryseobacterium aahli]MCI3937875.1 hypothetical protein [Chryseobacterium aahli]